MYLNSYNEWSPLKEVVVGSSFNYNQPNLELSFQLFFHDNVDLAFYYPSYQEKEKRNDINHEIAPNQVLKKQYLEELEEDIYELVATLENLDIKVHRPTSLNNTVKVTTPYWKANCIPALNVRDQVIIFGNEIIETAPLIRARYFENDLLKPILYHYFKKGAKWTCMPKPMMTDNSFDLSYVEETGRNMVATENIYKKEKNHFDVGHEIMIDAAQCIRFGKDILINVANENHELGLRWLENHFGDRFRFHRLYRMTDNHIDSIVLPLKPGKLLLRHKKFLELLPKPLQKWDIIYPPEPKKSIFPKYQNEDMILTSKYIDLNVLSVDEDRIIVNSLFPELISTLEKEGFTPIPVQHRHRRLFGGGFHCFTLDTVREGGLEDYFG